jgi:hypothetical protein
MVMRVQIPRTMVITEPEAEPEMEMVGARIMPEEVERAIGAAFSVGAGAVG